MNTIFLKLTLKQLFKIGLHLGHKTSLWNPSNFVILLGVRHDRHILNIRYSFIVLKRLYFFLKNIIRSYGTFLLIHRLFWSQHYFLSYFNKYMKWVSFFTNSKKFHGIISNYKTFFLVIKKMRLLNWLRLNKKYNFLIKKNLSKKLYKTDKLFQEKFFFFKGLVNFIKLPDFVFTLTSFKDWEFLVEANKKLIPVGGLVDSNFPYYLLDFPIPGNDDSIDVLNFFCFFFKRVIQYGLLEKKWNLSRFENRVKHRYFFVKKKSKMRNMRRKFGV